MRRSKEWWSALSKEERTRLVYLERSYKLSGELGGGGHLPDDCCECGSCSAPHLGDGLCLPCLQEACRIIDKADAACSSKRVI